MTFVLELPPDMEEQIQGEAVRQGQSPDVYALALLRSVLPSVAYDYATATPHERARAYQTWADSHTFVTAPPLPEEALQRESIYED